MVMAQVALPSWNDGAAKQRIVAFVEQVTNPSSPAFVPAAQRIATFDNDGTLLPEKPVFVQTAFMQKRVAELVKENPKLGELPAFQVFLERDPYYRQRMSKEELIHLVLTTHSGMSEEQFQTSAQAFLAEAKHARFGRLYTQLAYQPMLELMDYLKAHGFKVYICTGGGTEFVRTFAEELYGVPPEQVIGTPIELEFSITNGKPGFRYLNSFAAPFNNKKHKPMNIQRIIGRPPIIAVGNSDGDIEMLKFADAQAAGLAILLRHDDAVREYAYEEGAKGALASAKEHNWLVVSMAGDFARLFPGDSSEPSLPAPVAAALMLESLAYP